MKDTYSVSDTLSTEIKEKLDLYIRSGRNIYINGGPESGKRQLINDLVEQANRPMTEDQQSELIERHYPSQQYQNQSKAYKDALRQHNARIEPLSAEIIQSDLFTTHDVIDLMETYHSKNSQVERHTTFIESKYRIDASINEGGLSGLLMSATEMRHARNHVDSKWSDINQGDIANDMSRAFDIVVDIDTHETSDAIVHYVKQINTHRRVKTLKQDIHDIYLGSDVDLTKPRIETVGQSMGYNLAPQKPKNKQYVGFIPEVAQQLNPEEGSKQSLLHPSRGYLDKTGQYVGFEVRAAGLYTDNDIKQLNAQGINTDTFIKQTFPQDELKHLQNLMGYQPVSYESDVLENTKQDLPDNLTDERAVRYTLINTRSASPYIDPQGFSLSKHMSDAGFFTKEDVETLIEEKGGASYKHTFVAQPFTQTQLEQLPFEPMYAEMLPENEREGHQRYHTARQISTDVAKQLNMENAERFTLLDPSNGYLTKDSDRKSFDLTEAAIYTHADVKQLDIDLNTVVKQLLTNNQIENIPFKEDPYLKTSTHNSVVETGNTTPELDFSDFENAFEDLDNDSKETYR